VTLNFKQHRQLSSDLLGIVTPCTKVLLPQDILRTNIYLSQAGKEKKERFATVFAVPPVCNNTIIHRGRGRGRVSDHFGASRLGQTHYTN